PPTAKCAVPSEDRAGATGVLVLRRGPKLAGVPLPTALIPQGPIATRAQRDALARLGAAVLAGHGRYPALEDILARERPRLRGGFGGPIQTMELREQCERAAALDSSYLF